MNQRDWYEIGMRSERGRRCRQPCTVMEDVNRVPPAGDLVWVWGGTVMGPADVIAVVWITQPVHKLLPEFGDPLLRRGDAALVQFEAIEACWHVARSQQDRGEV